LKDSKTGFLAIQYLSYVRRKQFLLLGLIILTLFLLVMAISVGVVHVPPFDVLSALAGSETDNRFEIIVTKIRLPHALAALLAGAGLASAGVAMQSILRNPLGSPFTLGISQAGAFGAAFAVMFFSSAPGSPSGGSTINIANPWTTTVSAFIACMVTSMIIIAIARLRGASPETMVLSGVALGSLFSAGTMFLQYFADDVQLAAMVFWTFGDVGRAGWNEVWIMALVVSLGIVYFICNRWNYNAIDAGDETARSLGVSVDRVRMEGMIVASIITAVVVSFLGVIGFVGLICPHMVRRLIGDDMRFLMPASCLAGSILLLSSDIAARLIMAPHVLPVAILTSFLGAPTFLYLLISGKGR
jgi:iron complex transport system permease protein